jgi:hypothetical protein
MTDATIDDRITLPEAHRQKILPLNLPRGVIEETLTPS